jgi:hypothetical protein
MTTLLRAALAAALLMTAGCGGAPTLTGAAKSAKALSASGFAPTVLEDFSEDPTYRFDFYGPSYGHPFYQPVNFSKQKAAGSAVLELVAPNSTKPRKGYFLREMGDDEGSFSYQVGEADDKPIMKLSSRVRVGFDWAVNAGPSSELSLSAMSVFVFKSKTQGTAAIAYAWSNNLAPGRVLSSPLHLGEDSVPMRILVLEKGNGLGEQCSEAALGKMALTHEDRDLVADVRYAFAKDTPVADPGALMTTVDPGNKRFDPPSGGANTDLLALQAIGFGAEVPKAICEHAILDNVSLTIESAD